MLFLNVSFNTIYLSSSIWHAYVDLEEKDRIYQPILKQQFLACFDALNSRQGGFDTLLSEELSDDVTESMIGLRSEDAFGKE